MKKFLKFLAIGIVLVAVAFYFLGIPYFTGLITDYDRYTFEYVTENPKMVEAYGIADNRTPADYGYSNFEEVSYKTIFDGLNLNGWYIPAKTEVDQTLIISHGRTSNRLKTMKYLELISDYGLDTLYNVFIPDLRNSGKSDEAKTALGYEFAEDIVATMVMLKERNNQRDFVLWGFSMGAMASATAVNRPDLVEYMDLNNVKVNKLILASPLSNIKETAWAGAQEMGLPKFIFNMAWNDFDKQTEGYSDKMKFSYLLSNNKLPALVLYTDTDKQTPAPILEQEVEGLYNVYPILFKNADHVQIYTRPEYKQRYGNKVNEFLRMDF
ncbi:alpha/beta hydrolase [Roseivirga pacifica]|uniref:alpha/beta hydrolase n=1 Tax=Roseivirga pacifica TaxID=1267423 RepID=UPI003BAE2446